MFDCNQKLKLLLFAGLSLATAGNTALAQNGIVPPATAAAEDTGQTQSLTPSTAPALPLTGLVTSNVAASSSTSSSTLSATSASSQPGTLSPNQVSAFRPHQPKPLLAMQQKSAPLSPVRMLDDLCESAFHMKETDALAARDGRAKPGHLASMGKAVRYTISDFLEYRPSRSAAQAFLGTNKNPHKDSKHDPRPTRVIEATAAMASQTARNDSAFQVTAALMQLAKALGDHSNLSAGSEAQAAQRLNELMGSGQSQWLLHRFKTWAASVEASAREEMEQQSKSVDIIDQEDLVPALAAEAAAHDTTIANLKAALGLHDRSPSKAEVLLTGATLTPSLIGPTAMVAEGALEVANGGDRTKRLEDVLSLGLSLQERLNFLTRQSALAISGLDRAKLSKNAVMYAFSRDLIKKLQGK